MSREYIIELRYTITKSFKVKAENDADVIQKINRQEKKKTNKMEEMPDFEPLEVKDFKCELESWRQIYGR